MHGLLHDNYDIINLIKKFPVISKCYPISTSTASTYVWLKGQKGGKINGNSKKTASTFNVFCFSSYQKKINCIQDYLSLLEFFFQQVQLYYCFVFGSPETTILL